MLTGLVSGATILTEVVTMKYAIALIDKAAEMCGGSYYQLSKAWGVPQSRISEYRHGKREVPLDKVPKLAELAGVEPREAYLQVSIEQMPEGSEARDLLGKVRAAGVAAMLLFFVVPVLLLPSQSYAKGVCQVKPVYIVECRRRWREVAPFLRFLRFLRAAGRPFGSLRKPPELRLWSA